MRRLLTLFVLLMTAGAQGDEPPVVLIFGDSLSAGYGIDVKQSWAVLLQSRLERSGYEHRVINASISGETTAGGAARIRSSLSAFSPELVILELGGNDGLNGVPPQRMKRNIERIIARASASGAAVVLLGIRIPSNYGRQYTREFEAVYRDVAEDFRIRWIEFFMDGVAMNEELMQADRIHPNAAAQIVLLDNAWPIISAALAER